MLSLIYLGRRQALGPGGVGRVRDGFALPLGQEEGQEPLEPAGGDKCNKNMNGETCRNPVLLDCRINPVVMVNPPSEGPAELGIIPQDCSPSLWFQDLVKNSSLWAAGVS